MAISKVVYNNETLIDISGDTVTRDTLGYGVTAHDSSGAQIKGTLSMENATHIPTQTSDLENDLKFISNGTSEGVEFNGYVAVKNDYFFKIVSVDLFSNANVSASSNYVKGRVAVNQGDGWTPVAISGSYISSRYMCFYRLYLSGGNIEYMAYYGGNSTSNVSVNGRAYVLCIRTSI